jgi:general secretion pathway protein D
VSGRTGKSPLWLAMIACAICFFLSGCTGGNPSAILESPSRIDLGEKRPDKVNTRGQSLAGQKQAQAGKYQIFPGSGIAEGDDAETQAAPGVGETEDGKFTVNVEGANIPEAAKLILGETLGFSYIIDPRVQGTMTLSSNRALTSRELLNAFEAALRVNGAALVQSDGVTKIVALQEMLDGEMGTADLGSGVSAGFGVSAVPLRYISPANMMELMDSFIAHSGSVRASNVGNLILIRGTAEERQNLVEVVMSFDVDWMKAQSASIAVLANARPDDVANKLEAIFAEDSASSGRNAIKVIPVDRLNGVIVIANSKSKVRRALTWVKRLDQESTADTNYYVYALQNGNAVEVSKILNATFLEESGDAGASAEVAPDEETVQVSTEAEQPNRQQRQQPGNTEQTPQIVPDEPAQETEQRSAPGKTNLSSGIRITPNPANNTIVIRASPREYRKILATLRQIDSPATQVLINATIAEVTLNDNLRYGVQAFFRDDDVSGGIFTGNGLTLRPSFPGMNFFVGSIVNPKVVIDALAAVTKVKIVSSPSVLVLENETATIKVGDQVPIIVQSVEKAGDDDAVNSFEYRDTGVILKVKPRVNANGVVTIELGQELSAVSASGGTTAQQENPTFSQRAITSKVSVNDRQTVVLGGLISGQENRERDSVPGVNKVPVLGKLLGKTDNSARRTELIVFITPQIIRDGHEASHQSRDLRAKMKLLNWN